MDNLKFKLNIFCSDILDLSNYGEFIISECKKFKVSLDTKEAEKILYQLGKELSIIEDQPYYGTDDEINSIFELKKYIISCYPSHYNSKLTGIWKKVYPENVFYNYSDDIHGPTAWNNSEDYDD